LGIQLKNSNPEIVFAVFAVTTQNRKNDFAVNFAVESNGIQMKQTAMYKK
jgi:hypothetical protein